MTGPVRRVVAVAKADLRQRSRSSKLLVVPVLVAYFVKLVTVDSTLVVAENYTGELTVAWLAGMTAVIGTTVFLLFGYSLVEGNVRRDRETGVGQLLAPSPLTNGQYLVGKWLSNVVTLAVATGVLLASTLVSFLLQGSAGFDLVALVSPFLLITLPAMAVVAAAAVCFETVRLLRGTAGTVVYFVLAFFAVSVGVAPSPPIDLSGLALVRASMVEAIATQYPSFDQSAVAFAYTDDPGRVRVFSWGGITWTAASLATRLPVGGVAAGLLIVATRSFDRFDDSTSLLGWRDGAGESAPTDEGSTTRVAGEDSDASVTVNLASVRRDGGSFFRLLTAELRMALRGQPRWWYGACLLAVLAAGLAPIGVVRRLVAPMALLLPLSIWSILGAREHRHRTEALVFVGSRPGWLLGATYLSGVAVGAAVTFPAGVRFALAGTVGAVLGWIVGLLFLPAFALALGVWLGRPAVFEIVYLTAWYLGPVNGVEPVDYLGVWEPTVASGVPWVYAGLTVLSLAAAFVGRRRG